MAFKAKMSEKQGLVIVELSGSLDSLAVDDFDVTINKIKRAGRKDALLVMKKIKFVSSRAIGSLFALQKWHANEGGMVKIAEAPAKIMDTFRLVGLETFIPCFDSSSEAIASFHSDQ